MNNKIYKIEEISEEQLNNELTNCMISFINAKIDSLYADILRYNQNKGKDKELDKEFIIKLLNDVEIVTIDRELVNSLNSRMLHKVNIIIGNINNIVSSLAKDSIKYINNRQEELKYINTLNDKSKEELINIIKELKNNK